MRQNFLSGMRPEIEVDRNKERCHIAMNFWRQYSQADDTLMSLAKQGKIEDARMILEGECVELYNSLNNAFNEIITYNEEGSAEETAALKKQSYLYYYPA